MPNFIRDIEPKGNRNESHPTEINLPDLVEEPLLAACTALVRKNIRTVASTANKENVGSEAELLICAEHLSSENAGIAKKLGGREVMGGHWGHVFQFTLPVGDQSTVEEVAGHFDAIAAAFQRNPYTWANKWNFADALQMIGAPLSSTGETWNWQEMVAEDLERGAYYDEASGYVYANREEYEKERGG